MNRRSFFACAAIPFVPVKADALTASSESLAAAAAFLKWQAYKLQEAAWLTTINATRGHPLIFGEHGAELVTMPRNVIHLTVNVPRGTP